MVKQIPTLIVEFGSTVFSGWVQLEKTPSDVLATEIEELCGVKYRNDME